MSSPKLRFKEFSGNWNKNVIGSVISNKSKKFDPTKSKEDYPCIELEHLSQQTGYISGYCSAKEQKSIKNYFDERAVLFGKLRPYLKKYALPNFKGVCSSEIWVLSSKILSPEYLFQYIQTKSFLELALIQSGSKMPRAEWDVIADGDIYFPNDTEQTKIANFLTTVDKKISQLNEQHQLMIQYKKGVMQKIFSQEIRFKDDNGEDFGEWEEKLLGDIVTFSRGKGISKSDITKNGKNPCIRYGELYTKYGVVIDEINSFTDLKLKDCVLSKANQVIIPASGETKIDIATASCVLVDNVILGGDINILTSNENGIFLANYLNFSKRMEISQLAQGISVIHLYAKQLANLSIKLPCVKEQDKIAKFLRVLDNKIESLALQLELTKTWKKGLLQRMFV